MSQTTKVIVTIVAVSALLHIFAAGIWVGKALQKVSSPVVQTELQAELQAELKVAAGEPNEVTLTEEVDLEDEVIAPSLAQQIRMNREDVLRAHHVIQEEMVGLLKLASVDTVDYGAINTSMANIRVARVELLALLDQLLMSSFKQMNAQQRNLAVRQLMHRSLPLMNRDLSKPTRIRSTRGFRWELRSKRPPPPEKPPQTGY